MYRVRNEEIKEECTVENTNEADTNEEESVSGTARNTNGIVNTTRNYARGRKVNLAAGLGTCP